MGGHRRVAPLTLCYPEPWTQSSPSCAKNRSTTRLGCSIRMPKDYRIPPHTHPKPEIVTVISGTARLGMGETADRGKAQVLPTGSFFALSPGMAHYFMTDEDTVVQINSTGPWGISYVNAKDDPRQKTQ